MIETFARHGTPLNMEVELPSLEAIKRFVERGSGVALVPRLTVERELSTHALVAVPIHELRMERNLRLVWRKGAALSHAAQAFLRLVEGYSRQQGAPFCFEPEPER